MEIEENIGLNNKKDFEDQFTTFVSTSIYQLIFSILSLFSLSYSWTISAFLEHSSIRERKAKEG